MNRRVFIIEAGKAVPVVAGAIYLVGCSGNSSTSPSATATVQASSTTANGHSHTASFAASEESRTSSNTYTSSNVQGHDHQVTLSVAQFTSLAAGGSVTVGSTTSAVTGVHSHDFTFVGVKL
jgi:hypothetical protein